MELLQEKQRLRREMKRLRAGLSDHEKREMDSRLSLAFLQLPEITEANVVYCYVSYGSEPCTHGLITALLENGAAVAVPRVCGSQMEFFQIMKMEDLVPGYQGILEPNEHCKPVMDKQAPVLTPGLAFTTKGQRMGYGGGFYDRFFAQEPEHLRIAWAYPFQIVKSIPTGAFDQNVHRIITPDRMIETGGKSIWN